MHRPRKDGNFLILLGFYHFLNLKVAPIKGGNLRFADFLFHSSLRYEQTSPLGVPLYAFGQGIRPPKRPYPSVCPFCTIVQEPLYENKSWYHDLTKKTKEFFKRFLLGKF